MTIYETIKRKMMRATGAPPLHVGYKNSGTGESIQFHLSNGYSVEITFRDLAQLVREADRIAAGGDIGGPIPNLINWRELQ